MPNPMEKATVYLSKLKADRMAAMELSKEKELEAMLIKAREEGFREAMGIFGLNNTPNIAHNHFEAANHKTPGHAHAAAPICGHHRGPQLLVGRSP